MGLTRASLNTDKYWSNRHAWQLWFSVLHVAAGNLNWKIFQGFSRHESGDSVNKPFHLPQHEWPENQGKKWCGKKSSICCLNLDHDIPIYHVTWCIGGKSSQYCMDSLRCRQSRGNVRPGRCLIETVYNVKHFDRYYHDYVSLRFESVTHVSTRSNCAPGSWWNILSSRPPSPKNSEKVFIAVSTNRTWLVQWPGQVIL